MFINDLKEDEFIVYIVFTSLLNTSLVNQETEDFLTIKTLNTVKGIIND
jgi:hypothetical protein